MRVSEGLISYMRTDSTRLSDQFVKDAESYIEETYGRTTRDVPVRKTVKMHRMRMGHSSDERYSEYAGAQRVKNI